MSSYKDLTAQIEALKKEAEKARNNEVSSAIAEIKTKMNEYGITVADLGLKSTKPSKPKAAVAAKFRDDTSGATWSGRGKPPKWIAGKDRSAFAIKNS